jgi:hypothetical protein
MTSLGHGGAEVLNLPLPAGWSLPLAFASPIPPVARVAETDPLAHPRPGAAGEILPLVEDWPDLPAAAL